MTVGGQYPGLGPKSNSNRSRNNGGNNENDFRGNDKVSSHPMLQMIGEQQKSVEKVYTAASISQISSDPSYSSKSLSKPQGEELQLDPAIGPFRRLPPGILL